jgi:hypothetical protein
VYVRFAPAARFAAAVPLVPLVAEAVPLAVTVKAEAATARAVARGGAPFATTMFKVRESPVLAVVPPPTALAAVMLVAVSVAGLTELTVRLLVAGHWLHWSGFATVPFTETDRVPLVVGLADGITVQ